MIDPTNTIALRTKSVSEMVTRLRVIITDVHSVLVEQDYLGLSAGLSTGSAVFNNEWVFLDGPGKVHAFSAWITNVVELRFVAAEEGQSSWLDSYVQEAYQKASKASRRKLKPAQPTYQEPSILGRLGAFAVRARLLEEERIRLLQVNGAERLHAIGNDMTAQAASIVADGLLKGQTPVAITAAVEKMINELGRKRALLLADTQIIYTYVQSQLDTYQQAGVEEVGLLVEVLTAGDERVCERCQNIADEGPYPIETARDILPVHPHCRCAWVPIFSGIPV